MSNSVTFRKYNSWVDVCFNDILITVFSKNFSLVMDITTIVFIQGFCDVPCSKFSFEYSVWKTNKFEVISDVAHYSHSGSN
jgi:hypothetical protein